MSCDLNEVPSATATMYHFYKDLWEQAAFKKSEEGGSKHINTLKWKTMSVFMHWEVLHYDCDDNFVWVYHLWREF